MPGYGSLHSPSLQKMNGHMDTSRRSRHRFSFDNIIGDPFALATVSISLLAWVIAFVGSLIADIQDTEDDPFPKYAWWFLVYNLGCIIGVIVVVASDSAVNYHVALVGFLSAIIVMTSSSVNGLIYSDQAPKLAAAAGFMLLAMVAIVWVFYFGSTPSAIPHAYLDSFALHKSSPQRNSRGMSQHYGNGRPDTSVSSHQAPQMYTSAQLNGFETSSPVSGYPGGPIGANRNSSQPFGNSNTQMQNGIVGSSSGAPMTEQSGEVGAPTEYPYRAKAVYSYEANPDDANEISFTKHEILEVSDVSGRWWQAKKANGDTGIAPSNYLILL